MILGRQRPHGRKNLIENRPDFWKATDEQLRDMLIIYAAYMDSHPVPRPLLLVAVSSLQTLVRLAQFYSRKIEEEHRDYERSGD